jgi:hypothetical protein
MEGVRTREVRTTVAPVPTESLHGAIDFRKICNFSQAICLWNAKQLGGGAKMFFIFNFDSDN